MSTHMCYMFISYSKSTVCVMSVCTYSVFGICVAMFEYQVVDVLGDEEDDDDDNPVMDEGEHVYTLVLAQWYWSVCSTKVVFTTISTAWHYHYHFCDKVVNKQYLVERYN